MKILFSDLWSLLVLAELAFVGNIIFLIPLTAAVKNVGNLFQEEENLNFIIFSEKCKVVLCLVLLDADIFHHFWIILWCSDSVSGKINSYFFYKVVNVKQHSCCPSILWLDLLFLKPAVNEKICSKRSLVVLQRPDPILLFHLRVSSLKCWSCVSHSWSQIFILVSLESS